MRRSILRGMSVLFAAFAVGTVLAQQPAPAKAEPSKAAPAADAIVGSYRFKSGQDMTVEKSGDALTVKSTGNPATPLTAAPDGKYNFTAIPGYLTFDLDAAGKATTLNFHFDEKSLPAERIDPALAKKASDALELKIKNQTPDPACATTLKRLIEESRAGKPDYSKMTLTIAQATRSQLPMLQQRFQELGAVKEVKFSGVGPMGAEAFDVAFENGTTQWRIFCLPNGFISSVGFR